MITNWLRPDPQRIQNLWRDALPNAEGVTVKSDAQFEVQFDFKMNGEQKLSSLESKMKRECLASWPMKK